MDPLIAEMRIGKQGSLAGFQCLVKMFQTSEFHPVLDIIRHQPRNQKQRKEFALMIQPEFGEDAVGIGTTRPRRSFLNGIQISFR